MTLFNYLLNILTCFIEAFFFIYTAKSLLHLPIIPTKIEYIFLGLYCFAISLIPYKYGLILFLLNIVFTLGYILFILRQKFIDSLYLWGIINILLFSFQLIISSLFGLFHLNLTLWFFPILGNSLTLILAIVFLHIPFIQNLYKTLIHAKLPFRLIFCNTLLIMEGLLLYSKLQGLYHYPTYIYPWLFLSFILFLLASNSCLLYYEKALFISKQELLSYQKNLPIYESMIQEIRSNQHEYANHIQTLQSLPFSCQNYTSLCNALQNYTKDYMNSAQSYTFLQINSPLIAATLYHLFILSESKNIHIHYNLASSVLYSQAPEYHLNDFIYILIQNAIEASQENSDIYISLSSINNTTFFEIRNPSNVKYSIQQLNHFFKMGYTSKEKSTTNLASKHGYGLYNLKKRIEGYGGSIGNSSIDENGHYYTIFYFEV